MALTTINTTESRNAQLAEAHQIRILESLLGVMGAIGVTIADPISDMRFGADFMLHLQGGIVLAVAARVRTITGFFNQNRRLMTIRTVGRYGSKDVEFHKLFNKRLTKYYLYGHVHSNDRTLMTHWFVADCDIIREAYYAGALIIGDERGNEGEQSKFVSLELAQMHRFNKNFIIASYPHDFPFARNV